MNAPRSTPEFKKDAVKQIAGVAILRLMRDVPTSPAASCLPKFIKNGTLCVLPSALFPSLLQRCFHMPRWPNLHTQPVKANAQTSHAISTTPGPKAKRIVYVDWRRLYVKCKPTAAMPS